MADADELAALLTLNGPALLSYLVRRVEIREDAGDVLAETFLVAWRRASLAPSEPEAGRMWLFGIAKNCLRNHYRGSRRRRALAETLRDDIRHSAPVDDRTETIDLRNAVESLPTDQRELILLVHGDGFAIEEAATLLGVSASTLRSRHATAKATLRKVLSLPVEIGER